MKNQIICNGTLVTLEFFKDRKAYCLSADNDWPAWGYGDNDSFCRAALKHDATMMDLAKQYINFYKSVRP